MTKKDRQQLEYDIWQAYKDLDQVFAIAQLLSKYFDDRKDDLNPWMVKRSLEALMSLIIEVQCNLETSLDSGNE